MANIKVYKGKTVKTIPADFKDAYITAGWKEYKQTKYSVDGMLNKKV